MSTYNASGGTLLLDGPQESDRSHSREAHVHTVADSGLDEVDLTDFQDNIKTHERNGCYSASIFYKLNLDNKYLEIFPPLSLKNPLSTTPKPPFITCIILRGNKGMHLREEIVAFANLEILDIRWCALESLPYYLERLERLQELIVSNNNFEEMPEVIAKMVNLRKLSLSYCGLTGLPDELSNLRELQELIVSCNKLGEVPEVILKMVHLQKLHIDECDLTSLPDQISKLEKLQILNVSNNGLSSLPESFGYLKALRNLYASHNRLTSLPKSLGDIVTLQELYVGSNRLMDLPDSVGNLAALRELVATHNELSSLPESMGKLISLRRLKVGNNKLSSLPESLKHLSALHRMEAWHNLFQHYPDVLTKLKGLKTVELSNFGGFERKNSIKELPISIKHCICLEELDLNGNPLAFPPPEICAQGAAAVRLYLEDISSDVAEVCSETISTLGETGAGKSSVVLSLMHGESRATASEDRTSVMSQCAVTLANGVDVVVNDFGGHEVYRSVLPILLPTDGLATIVYDMTATFSEQKAEVEKWLDTSMAKSPKLKCIVIGTHLDNVLEENISIYKTSMEQFIAIKRRKYIDEHSDHINRLESVTNSLKYKSKEWKALFGNKLKDLKTARKHLESGYFKLVCLSCNPQNPAPGGVDGLQQLKNLLCDTLNAKVPVPASWCRFIKGILRPQDAVLKKALWLTKNQVDDTCARAFPDENFDARQRRQKVILSYLAKTCQIVWLKDHATLCGYVFHSIENLLNALRSVLHHDTSSQLLSDRLNNYSTQYEEGVLTEDLLKHLLERHSREHGSSNVVSQLLVNFNLALDVSGRNASSKLLIIPSLLSNETPDIPYDMTMSVHVVIRFVGSILPLSLFETSLAVVAKKHVLLETYARFWKHGVALMIDKAYVLFRRISGNGDLRIDFRAWSPSVENLLEVGWPMLSTMFEHISSVWKGALYDAYVVCPGCELMGKPYGDAHAFMIYNNPLGTDSHLCDHADIRDLREFEGMIRCKVCLKNVPRSLREVCCEDLDNADFQAATEFWDGQFSEQCNESTGEHYKNDGGNSIAVAAAKELLIASRSVAKITKSGVTLGTGFRVGTRYLLTAAHLVNEIIADTMATSARTGPISASEVYAVFDLVGEMQFHFDYLCWCDDYLDVALLRFDKTSSNDPCFPDPLRSDMLLKEENLVNGQPVFICGYNAVMEIDLSAKVFRPDFSQLDKELFSEAQETQNHTIFYKNAKLKYGSSGSPVFAHANNRLYLVAVHTRGYPAQWADRTATRKVIEFQAGARVFSIRYSALLRDEAIWKDIFLPKL